MRLTIFKENPMMSLNRDSKIKEVLNHYSDETNEWIIDVLNGNPFQEFGKELMPFELKMDNEKPDETDIENAKILYDKLKFLSDSQASEERLWAALTHNHFWNYMQYRWPLSKKEKRKTAEGYIRERYFFSSNVRGKFFNGLSRLWWFARLTYDENRDNKYELLEYFYHGLSGKAYPLFGGQNFSSNPLILKDYFYAIFEFEKKRGKSLDRIELRKLNHRINLVGGTLVLDYLAETGHLRNLISNILSNIE